MIKQIVISFFFLLLSNTSFAQNEFNKKGQREGLWIGYHDNNLIKYSGQFFNGKEHGIFTYYNLTGNVAIELNYIDTGLTSKATIYYPNGAVKSQGIYHNKKKSDLWTTYNISGQKIQQEHYDQGLLDGESVYYYKSGLIAELYNYIDGEKNGIAHKFYKSGILNMKCSYNDNFLHGLIEFYYNSRKQSVESRGRFNMGRKDSVWEFYNEEGVLIKTQNYSYED